MIARACGAALRLIAPLRDDRGSVTVQNMIWMATLLAASGFASDTANAFRTKAMLQAAADAARVEIAVDCLKADDVEPAKMLAASAYLFVCPENLGTMSGAMKEFFDRCYYPVLGKIEGRPYAQMVCAGSDGENAVRQTARIATGWRLKAVHEPVIICTHAQTETEILAQKEIAETDLEICRTLGRALAAGLAMGVF